MNSDGRGIDLLGFPDLQLNMLKEGPHLDVGIRGKMQCILMTSAPPMVPSVETAIMEHRKFLFGLQKEYVRPIYGREDLENLSGQVGVLCGLQNTPDDTQNEDIHTLFAEGIRFLTLSYEGKNAFGGGYGAPDVGLTRKGHEILFDFQETGMLLDLAHVGHRSALDQLESAKGVSTRVFASHTGCHEVYEHERNFRNEVLRNIAEQGGVVGIYALTFGVSANDDSLEAFVAHVKHALDVCGEAAVCVGSDCIHRNVSNEDNRAHFEKMCEFMPESVVEKIGPRYPDRPQRLIEGGSQMFDHLREALEAGGVPERTISNVLHGNALSFLRDALPHDPSP